MSEYPETADGTLVIMVCRAKHLPNRRKLDKQSPYVLLRLNTVAKKTPSQFRAGQTPEWTHEIRFMLSRDRKPLMKLDVLDETKSDPTPIGSTEIDCSLVFSDQANLQDSGKYILDGWYDLAFNSRFAGKIYLEMTFYPSVPVVPPKLSLQTSAKALPTPPPLENEEIFDDFSRSASEVREDANGVFVSGSPKKKSLFRSSEPDPSAAEKPRNSRLAKLKDRFMAKEPISAFFEPRSPKPDAYCGEDLDQLQTDIGLGQYLPADLSPPPPPPPHKTAAGGHGPHEGSGTSLAAEESVLYAGSRSPRRKPPPAAAEPESLPSSTTKIPFSADSFHLDDAEELPTKVYHLGQQVRSLSVQERDGAAHRVNPNEIDPRFYAPTPSEHLAKSFRLQGGNVLARDLEVDLNTQNTGYLGEGKWSVEKDKFSPSVFQRIRENDDNSGESNKPPVPPKIPSGLTANEYYLLEKESFLKDVNGRRH